MYWARPMGVFKAVSSGYTGSSSGYTVVSSGYTGGGGWPVVEKKCCTPFTLFAAKWNSYANDVLPEE